MDAPHPAEEREEIAQAIRLIEGVMRAEEVSAEELDARLGRPAGATAAVLAAREPARGQVLAILAALELEADIFFRSLAAEDRGLTARREPLFERLAAEVALAGYAPHPADEPASDAPPPDPAELERRVREAIRAALAGEGPGRR
jgi:hypothetical protein